MARDGHSREAPLASLALTRDPRELKQFDHQSNRHQCHLEMSATLLEQRQLMDVPGQFHHQLITRRQAEATLSHTDA